MPTFSQVSRKHRFWRGSPPQERGLPKNISDFFAHILFHSWPAITGRVASRRRDPMVQTQDRGWLMCVVNLCHCPGEWLKRCFFAVILLDNPWNWKHGVPLPSITNKRWLGKMDIGFIFFETSQWKWHPHILHFPHPPIPWDLRLDPTKKTKKLLVRYLWEIIYQRFFSISSVGV